MSDYEIQKAEYKLSRFTSLNREAVFFLLCEIRDDLNKFSASEVVLTEDQEFLIGRISGKIDYLIGE